MELNLPVKQLPVTRSGDGLYLKDVIRKKWLKVTPEEWVRQHLLLFFIEHLNYPKNLIGVEKSLQYGSLSKRSDVVVWDREGKPWLLAECKAPYLEIDDEVIYQAALYYEQIKPRHIILTNGIAHYHYDSNRGEEFKEVKEWPKFPG